MVTKRSLLTKREHLKRKLRQLFADREKEINLFRRFVTDGDDYHLLHVMGIGGIGKTALLEAFGSICDAEQIPWVLANVGDQELPISLVRFIASQLTKAGLTLSHLQEALARYELLDQKVRADKRIRPEVLRVILTGMTSRSDVGEKDAGQQAQQALSYLAKVLGGEDANFYLNPAPQFTEALLADLAGLANTQRVCLMFDRYERISAYLDEWIRQELFPNLADNVLVVTSGRQGLPATWQEWLPIVRTLELEPLSEEDTQLLVRLRGILSEPAIKEIAKLTGGLPLAASIAADVLRESGASHLELGGSTGHLAIVGELVRKLTEEAPVNLRGWLEQCAIVRWFNEETLERFVGIAQGEVADAYARLGRLSFVQPHPHGLALHDLVREFIAEDLAKRAKRRYTELHRKAALYYEQLIGETQQQEAQSLAVELVYHLLRADEDEGFGRLRELFDNANDFSQAEFSVALLETAHGLELRRHNKLWLEFFEGLVWQQKNVDNLKSARLLEQLLSRPEIEQYPELQAHTAAYLAVALRYIGNHDLSLNYASVGLELSRGLNLTKPLNRSLEALGLLFNRLGQFSKAIETQLELLELTRQSSDQIGEVWSLNDLGYTSWHAGKWTQAEQYLLRCRALLTELRSFYNLVYPLGHLGLLYIAVGRLEEAERFLMESLRICQEEKNLEMESKTLQNLADLRRIQGRLDEALTYIDQALEISKHMSAPYFIGACFRRRGEILAAVGDLDGAGAHYLESLDQARKINVQYGEAKVLVALLTLQLRGWKGNVPGEPEKLQSICREMGYYHILSDLRHAQALFSFEEQAINQGKQECLESLVYGMLYNRYWLYNQLSNIKRLITQWQVMGEQSRINSLVEYLDNAWRVNSYEGVVLLSLEGEARNNEPGIIPLPELLTVQLQTAVQSPDQ